MEFVLISLCRSIVLLSYFNPQEANLTSCNNCDICELRPFTSIPQSVDFTVKVQEIVDSIQQVVDKPFTIKYLAQVVSGKNNKKINENGHDTLPAFGILKYTTKKCELFLMYILTKDILREVSPPRGSANSSFLQVSLGSQYMQYVTGQTKLIYQSLGGSRLTGSSRQLQGIMYT